MNSFDLQYDADEDYLEVVFEDSDNQLVRNIELTESIVLYSTALMDRIWGLSISNYAKDAVQKTSLQTLLHQLAPEHRQKVLKLLTDSPAAGFVSTTAGDYSSVQLLSPTLLMLMEGKNQ